MRQLVRRSRRAGWPIEGTLWRCPGQARRRACCVPLAVACGAAPLQPRKRRAQHQHAAHQAAECCTGVQRTLRRCGAASPRPVHGADERRHGLPPAAGSAHFPKEAQDAPAVYAALCSAAHGPRHTKPTLSLAKRLSAEGLAARTRLLRGHALRPGERGAGTQPFLESCVPFVRDFVFSLKFFSNESLGL